ncbi:MAG: helix-turn-helix domain-containing protein [Candidatus Aenigmarchaeota archaeon]|nr:helix-turn-helix domain-containing protein [Candidatus Aenigmarchaeota archaeon]
MEYLEELKKKIAGEIVLSENAGETIKKWRQLFRISQTELASKLEISPSVISDYESGRRKSPGTKLIHRVVESLMDIDSERGGKIIEEFTGIYKGNKFSSFVLAMKEFSRPVGIKEFLKEIDGEVCYPFLDENIYGYSLIDSEAAIIHFSPTDITTITSLINNHCLIFTNLSRGRSPLIAIRLANLRPGLVVLHGIEKVDDTALRTARIDKIPLAISYTSTKDRLLERLKAVDKLFG